MPVPMADAAYLEDCECLRVDPGAGVLELERAYRRMKLLYAENSLATYSLLDEEARRQRLDEIERAYRRLRGSGKEVQTAEEPMAVRTETVDPAQAPGWVLKVRREELGMSLREISRRTKIGCYHLENIEEGKFSRLPAPVYLRGFVIEFARVLGFAQPAEIAYQYLQRCEHALLSE